MKPFKTVQLSVRTAVSVPVQQLFLRQQNLVQNDYRDVSKAGCFAPYCQM
jgi:hypothetical protein